MLTDVHSSGVSRDCKLPMLRVEGVGEGGGGRGVHGFDDEVLAEVCETEVWVGKPLLRRIRLEAAVHESGLAEECLFCILVACNKKTSTT